MPYRRGIYLTSDSMDNWSLAKCHTKPNKNRWKHLPHREGFPIVTADEVLEKLMEMGVKRDKRTLRRYAEKGLIYKPETKSMGRGKGKTADYPNFTPEEFFASWSLINGYNLTYNQLKRIRDVAMKYLKLRLIAIDLFIKQYPDFRDNPERMKTYKFLVKSNYLLGTITEMEFNSQSDLPNHFECYEELFEYAAIWFRLLCDENATDIANTIFEKKDVDFLNEIIYDDIEPIWEDIERMAALMQEENHNMKD